MVMRGNKQTRGNERKWEATSKEKKGKEARPMSRPGDAAIVCCVCDRWRHNYKHTHSSVTPGYCVFGLLPVIRGACAGYYRLLPVITGDGDCVLGDTCSTI